MPASFSLKTLLDLSRNRSDAAAKKLGYLNLQEQAANQKLLLLMDYRHDYEIRFRDCAKNGIGQTEWRNFIAFMNKLDAAIAAQHKTVAHSRYNREAGGDEFISQQRKLKSYDTLAQRYQRAAIRLENKREQREQDEHAANSTVYNQFAL